MQRGGKYHLKGFSLIELSIATAVFSMGIGSFSLLLLLALHGTAESRYQSTAVTQAESMAERVLMNPDAVGHYIYPAAASPGACNAVACTPEEMAFADVSEWRAALARSLPRGTGIVCRDASPDDGDGSNAACDDSGGPVIKVFWNEPVNEEDEDSARRLVSRLPLP